MKLKNAIDFISQSELYETIIEFEELLEDAESLIDFDDDGILNEFRIKKVMLTSEQKQKKRERQKDYKKNKLKIKKKADRYRKTSDYKKAKKKREIEQNKSSYVRKQRIG